MKCGFIVKHRGSWPTAWLCEALGVSRGGFYAWLTRPRSQRARRDEVLGAKIRTSFLQSDRTYGARRVWHDLLAEGEACGLHRIERLMRQQAFRARPRRRRMPVETGPPSSGAISPNVLNRQFEAVAPNRKWRRGKPEAVLHHSDRGSQYTSEPLQRLLADHGLACSMSRSGNCWDNAAMESFFSTLKTECTARTTYRTRNQARADVFDYIERFYNPRRRHSTLGYLSPMEFERQATEA